MRHPARVGDHSSIENREDQRTAAVDKACSIFVVGANIKCPLCGVLVSSGQHHICTQPEPRQPGPLQPARVSPPRRSLSLPPIDESSF
jgi:hypothetical protein